MRGLFKQLFSTTQNCLQGSSYEVLFSFPSFRGRMVFMVVASKLDIDDLFITIKIPKHGFRLASVPFSHSVLQASRMSIDIYNLFSTHYRYLSRVSDLRFLFYSSLQVSRRMVMYKRNLSIFFLILSLSFLQS